MSITVLDPGPQATLQGAARRGLRQMGMPASGAADPVSQAIANRLVDRPPEATAIEIGFGPAAFRFDAAMQIGFCGADADIAVDGAAQPAGQTLTVKAGQTVSTSAFRAGARLYLAVSGRIAADEAFGSESTYLPAALGGFQGRALRKGDRLDVRDIQPAEQKVLPPQFRIVPAHAFALRAVPGPDWMPDHLVAADTAFQVTGRASRMGVEIEGPFPALPVGLKPSSAVMPGALQVTPGGRGFLLLADGQTTGGYPHLLQVTRADRHLIGQLRPRDRVTFLMRTQEKAEAELRAKQALLESWMPGFRL